MYFHSSRSTLSTLSSSLASIASLNISLMTPCENAVPSSIGPCSGDVDGDAV